MVSEHMLTVERDPRNWQAHSKDFSLQLFLSKRSFTSLLFSVYSKILFSETIPLSPFDHSKIRLMRPLQEVQDIRQLRPPWNEEYSPCIWIMETTTVEDRRQVEFEGPVEFSRSVWPRKATLMELGRLWKLSMLEIKVCWRKTGACRVKNSRICRENPKAGDIHYGMIAHGNDKSRNMDIHDVIVHLCYCHHTELSCIL